jgi:hypothetical protein
MIRPGHPPSPRRRAARRLARLRGASRRADADRHAQRRAAALRLCRRARPRHRPLPARLRQSGTEHGGASDADPITSPLARTASAPGPPLSRLRERSRSDASRVGSASSRRSALRRPDRRRGRRRVSRLELPSRHGDHVVTVQVASFLPRAPESSFCGICGNAKRYPRWVRPHSRAHGARAAASPRAHPTRRQLVDTKLHIDEKEAPRAVSGVRESMRRRALENGTLGVANT